MRREAISLPVLLTLRVRVSITMQKSCLLVAIFVDACKCSAVTHYG